MDKQEFIKLFLYCYAGLWVVFLYLVYRFFDSEIKRLNPPRKSFISLKGSDIISVDLSESIKRSELLCETFKRIKRDGVLH